MTPLVPLTAQDMRVLLWRKYSGRCAVLFEVAADGRLEPGEHPRDPNRPNYRHRIIDALTVAKARKRDIGPLDLMAIEIKVSRSDFLADVRDPRKQAAWREIAHRHAFAVPEGLVRPGEVPDGSGLLIARPFQRGGGHYLEWAQRAPYSTPPAIPAWLTLGFAWRVSSAEAKLRGISSETRDGDDIEDLRGRLVKLRAEHDALNRRHDSALTEIGEWKRAFAAAHYLPCERCGKPVKPKSVRAGYFSGWRHLRAADEDACAANRGRYAEIRPADDAEVPELAS